MSQSESSAEQSARSAVESKSSPPREGPSPPPPAPNFAQNDAPDAAQSASPAGEASTREFLGMVGGARLMLDMQGEPWRLPLDALVLPVGVERRLGGVGSGFVAALESAGQAGSNELVSRIAALQPFSADQPRLISYTPPRREFPRALIAATAYGEKPSDWMAGARRAVTRVIEICAVQRLRRVALPILMSRSADVSWETAARTVARAVLDAPSAGSLEEITLCTLSREAAQEIRDLFRTRAQGVRNDLAQGEDLLAIHGEVHSLADMLLLRETRPPLVVGILGGWGSGKSFAMHLMKERMREIRSIPLAPEQAWGDDPERLSPYAGHVYLVHFDAWTYAKSNLWASLMQTIFGELNRQLTIEHRLTVECKRSPLDDGGLWRLISDMDPRTADVYLEKELGIEALNTTPEARLDVLWKRLRELNQKEIDALTETEKRLADSRAALAQKQKDLADVVDGKMEAEARWVAWKPLMRELAGLRGPLNTEFKQQLAGYVKSTGGENVPAPTLDEILASTSLWKRVKRARPVELVPFVVFGGVAAIIPFALEKVAAYKLPTEVLAAASAALGLLRTMTNYNRWITDQYDRYEKTVSEERAHQESRKEDLMKKELAKMEKTELENQTKAATPAGMSIPALDHEIKRLEAEAAQHRQRIGFTAGFVSLDEFLQSRLKDGEYEQQLGLMQRVQRDLMEMSDSLMVRESDPYGDQKRKMFPRGLPRVVLFIDDLDRCPPLTVVQVLEAAQLLVKTELFVVVIAMDVRYITRALESEYRGILVRRGDPSGLDYIEKIIQIPYQVRPIDPDAVQGYLESQMRIEAVALETDTVSGESSGSQGSGDGDRERAPGARGAAAPLPTSVLAFDRGEFETLKCCCERIALSPRAIKRLINVYKLLKIIWYRSSRHAEPVPDVKQAVVLLLALAARFPDILRLPYEALGRAVASRKGSLQDFFTDYRLVDRDSISVDDWKQCLELLKDKTLLPPDLLLSRIDLTTFNLVQAFSFLGDIGYELSDPALQSAPSGTP